MDGIRVLLVEDNALQLEILRESLGEQAGINIVGTAVNGVEALEKCRELCPQVLVCDLVMPHMDGFTLLDKLDPAVRPMVIALTSLNRADFIKRALELGVSDYMIKPVHADALAARIRGLVSPDVHTEAIVSDPAHAKSTQRRRRSSDKGEHTCEQLATSMLMQLGVPPHLSGYAYLQTAIVLTVASPDLVRRLTHTLYPLVAERHHTTPGCVERAIRHAAAVAWDRGAAASLHRLLGRNGPIVIDKPTNGELIAQLSERIRLSRVERI